MLCRGRFQTCPYGKYVECGILFFIFVQIPLIPPLPKGDCGELHVIFLVAVVLSYELSMKNNKRKNHRDCALCH